MKDTDSLRKKFTELRPFYKRLGNNVHEALETFLSEAKISFLAITWRIKDIESFVEKIDRKNYSDPFNQIEDICGIRIICYYQSDIKRICQIIQNEFDIQENQDKEELLNADQFGYRSYHFIGKINEKWLEAPNYRGLQSMKFEIQVRTILMHAWAEIEHKLAYKQKVHIPAHLKRRLYRISAKLEEADEQFEDIKNESIEYREGLVSKGQTEGEQVYKNVEFNLDSFQSFLDYKFPNREKDIDQTRNLFNEIISLNIGLDEIIDGLETLKPFINDIEKEIFEDHLKEISEVGWAQVGIIRKVLDITNDDYYNMRFTGENAHSSSLLGETDKWRKKITKTKK